MIDNINDRRVRSELFEDKSNVKFHTISFYLSLFGSVLAVGLLFLLIAYFPHDYSTFGADSHLQTIYDNFFYDVIFRYDSPTYHAPYISCTYAFYLMIIIIVSLLFFCGTGFFISNKKARNINILLNWIFYSGLIGVYLLYLNNFVNLSFYEEFYHILGTFPIMLNVPIQLALLLDGSSFLHWSRFEKIKNKNDFNIIYRRINAIIFLFCYLFMALIPILVTTKNFDFNNFYFLSIVIGLPIYLGWFLFGEIARKILFRVKRKQMILILISQGERSLATISSDTGINLRSIKHFILHKINTGEIMAELSEDDMIIIPKEPSLFFSKVESKEKSNKISTRMDEQKVNTIKFWISICSTIIGVLAITIIIMMIPTKDSIVYSYFTPQSGSNFCYFWNYHYDSYEGYYVLRDYQINTGFIVLTAIGILSLTISFFGIFEKRDIETQHKTQALLNIALYSIPIIVSIIKTIIIESSGIISGGHINSIGLEFSTIGFIYFLPFIYLQASLFLENKSFREWFGIGGNTNGTKKVKSYGRMINGIIFLLMFVWMWIYPILFTSYTLYHENYVFRIQLIFNCIMISWWIFSDLLRIVINKEQKKNILKGIYQLDVDDFNGIAARLEMPVEFVEDYLAKLYFKENLKNKSLSTKSIGDELPNKQNKETSPVLDHYKGKNDRIKNNRILAIISLIISTIILPSVLYLTIKLWIKYNFVYMIIIVFVIIGVILGVYTSYFTRGKIGYILNGLILIELSMVFFYTINYVI